MARKFLYGFFLKCKKVVNYANKSSEFKYTAKL